MCHLAISYIFDTLILKEIAADSSQGRACRTENS